MSDSPQLTVQPVPFPFLSTAAPDGKAFGPRFSVPASAGLYDRRCHPAVAHAHELISVNSAGTELSRVDVATGRQDAPAGVVILP